MVKIKQEFGWESDEFLFPSKLHGRDEDKMFKK